MKNHVDMQHLRIIEEPEYSDSSGGGSVKNYDTELQDQLREADTDRQEIEAEGFTITDNTQYTFNDQDIMKTKDSFVESFVSKVSDHEEP